MQPRKPDSHDFPIFSLPSKGRVGAGMGGFSAFSRPGSAHQRHLFNIPSLTPFEPYAPPCATSPSEERLADGAGRDRLPLAGVGLRRRYFALAHIIGVTKQFDDACPPFIAVIFLLRLL